MSRPRGAGQDKHMAVKRSPWSRRCEAELHCQAVVKPERASLLLTAALLAGCAVPPNPVVQGNHVTLYIESEQGITPNVTGDFTAWKPIAATPMARGSWFQYDTTLEPDARVEYLISFGPKDLRVDERNPRRVATVGGHASEIVMPAFEAQPETAATDSPRGVFDQRELDGPGGTRKVVVYRPPGSTAPLPVVYFHDGSLMIERGRVPQVLDWLIAAGKLRPLVAVFVDPVSRADDYKADPVFRDWFVNVLVPQVESGLAFLPTGRAVIGVSRSAIAAIDISWHHPDLFSRCGLLIPSTSPTNVTEQIARGPDQPVRFSIVAARYDAEWLKEGRALHDALDAKGYQQTYREVPEGHNVQTWRAHLDDVLIGLGF